MWSIEKERISPIDREDTIIHIKDDLKLIRDRAILLCMFLIGQDTINLLKLKEEDFKQGHRQEYNFSYLHGER